jgi:hypothetical protein
LATPCCVAPSNTNRFLLRNAANYVQESVQGTGAEASKESNKNVAKDSDASLTSRATAAKDAVVDKKDEKSQDAKADVHKGNISHSLPSLDSKEILTMI